MAIILLDVAIARCNVALGGAGGNRERGWGMVAELFCTDCTGSSATTLFDSSNIVFGLVLQLYQASIGTTKG